VKTIISAPWGQVELEEDGAPENGRRTVEFALEQLKDIQRKGNKTDYLKRDIAGYVEVLKFPDHVCSAFLKVKHEARATGNKFADNLAVVKFLRDQGILGKEEV
jgi:hypothetical protein